MGIGEKSGVSGAGNRQADARLIERLQSASPSEARQSAAIADEQSGNRRHPGDHVRIMRPMNASIENLD